MRQNNLTQFNCFICHQYLLHSLYWDYLFIFYILKASVVPIACIWLSARQVESQMFTEWELWLFCRTEALINGRTDARVHSMSHITGMICWSSFFIHPCPSEDRRVGFAVSPWDNITADCLIVCPFDCRYKCTYCWRQFFFMDLFFNEHAPTYPTINHNLEIKDLILHDQSLPRCCLRIPSQCVYYIASVPSKQEQRDRESYLFLCH